MNIPPMIPQIIHQAWPDRHLPHHLAALQQTWLEHHPDWEYRLWTDAESRDFLAAYYQWFLPIYDRIVEHGDRVEMLRYFWLDYYGGVYVGLDFECLAPLDNLLADRSLGLSISIADNRHRNLPIASCQNHPFWTYIWEELNSGEDLESAVDLTEDFSLIQAYQAYPHQSEISILSPDLFDPVAIVDRGKLFSLSERSSIAMTAIAIRHQIESSIDSEVANVANSLLIFERGQQTSDAKFSYPAYRILADRDANSPLVSALMVTKNRVNLAKRAIFCFQQQTHPHKELVIIDDSDRSELEEFVRQFSHPQIAYYRLPAEQLTLGELRNIAVAKAKGNYICQWDDDDLYDPLRLELQLAVIQAFKVDGCFLDNLYNWWPYQQRLARSCRRLWECTLMCRKDILPAYPSQRKGEDTEVLTTVIQNHRLAALNRPELYIYGIHQNNTWNPEHFDEHWQAASIQFEGDAYIEQLDRFARRFPIHSYLQSLQSS
jgi:hypothetical protein